MKTIDELLIAWRDGSITATELKDLEKLLAEPGAREQLFDEFLMTATIAEALKVETASPQIQKASEPARRPVSRLAWLAAAALVLLTAGAVYLAARSQAPLSPAPSPKLVEQTKDQPVVNKPAVADEGHPLPPALRGFSGGMNGEVMQVDKDSIVLKLSIAFAKMGLQDKEVVVLVKDVKDLPQLNAGDGVYLTASEVDGRLVATKLFKAKGSKQSTKRAPADEF